MWRKECLQSHMITTATKKERLCRGGEILEYFNPILSLTQDSLRSRLPSCEQHRPQRRVYGWIFKTKIKFLSRLLGFMAQI